MSHYQSTAIRPVMAVRRVQFKCLNVLGLLERNTPVLTARPIWSLELHPPAHNRSCYEALLPIRLEGSYVVGNFWTSTIRLQPRRAIEPKLSKE